MQDYSKTIPNIASRLRHNILELPKEIRRASGIVIYGRRIKSLVFTTDLAIIKNCDADAVFAVYPFTPQQSISDAIIKASYVPVFCGVGGGTTQGIRTVSLARDVECQGAMGVVLNAPISNLNLRAVSADLRHHLWRNTQVWLKGPVLKTGRSWERRRGSNPFSSAICNIAGWSSSVARWAHNPEVVGSNPSPATILVP